MCACRVGEPVCVCVCACGVRPLTLSGTASLLLLPQVLTGSWRPNKQLQIWDLRKVCLWSFARIYDVVRSHVHSAQLRTRQHMHTR